MAMALYLSKNKRLQQPTTQRGLEAPCSPSASQAYIFESFFLQLQGTNSINYKDIHFLFHE
jgi:hypothetical protein